MTMMTHKDIKKGIIELALKVSETNAFEKNDKERRQCHDLAQKILLGLDGDKNSSAGDTSGGMIMNNAPQQQMYQFNKEKASMNTWDLRSYFSYQLINQQLEFRFDMKKTNEFISLFFPKPLNKRQSMYCSYLISFVMSFRHQQLLNCLTQYVLDCDSIQFPVQPMDVELARDSPGFCSAVITRGYFQQHQSGKDNLTQWLRTLIDLLPGGKEHVKGKDHKQSSSWIQPIGLNHAIRYSFQERPNDHELHLAILNMIKHKKCQTLTNHFLIDLATSISTNRSSHKETQQSNSNIEDLQQDLKDRFAQILLIAFANQMCSQSNQLKNILKDKFSEQDVLIKAFAEI